MVDIRCLSQSTTIIVTTTVFLLETWRTVEEHMWKQLKQRRSSSETGLVVTICHIDNRNDDV